MDQGLEPAPLDRGSAVARARPSGRAVVLGGLLVLLVVAAVVTFAVYGDDTDAVDMSTVRAQITDARARVEACAEATSDGGYATCERSVADALPGTVFLQTTARTYALEYRGTDGRVYRLRQNAEGQIGLTCRPDGGGCRQGSWRLSGDPA